MSSSHCRRVLLLGVLSFLLASTLVGMACAQGLRQTPYSDADVVRRGPSGGGLTLAPSNPLGLPGSTTGLPRGSDSLYLSDGMLQGILPLIPNLQFGYLYNFGNNSVSSGRFTADYLLPISLSRDSTLFGEAHTEFQDFRNTTASASTSGTTTRTVSGFNNRTDMSFGGGYRTLHRHDTLLGVNGFYDTSRLGGNWYSSGSVGFETAVLVSGDDALDINFNWYGRLFESDVIRNAFRYGPANYDFEAGYSHQLWEGGPDLRLRVKGYQFDIGTRVYGGNAGAELKSRDGMFSLKYDVGNDKINQTYQTIGGFVNVGFQLENVLKGESPFTMPEPIFKSPRNLRQMLTQKVNRDWHQPSSVVLTRDISRNGSRQMILVSVYRGPTQGGTLTADVPNNSWTVNTGGGDVSNDFAYTFRMSDNSIQNVRMTVALTSGTYYVGFGYSGGGFVRGPAPMDGTVSNSATMFGPVSPGEYHWGDGAGNGSGFVTFDVPSDPSIAPLVVNFQFIEPHLF